MEQQVREFRIVDYTYTHNPRKSWAVEYGFWRETGGSRRFMIHRSWAAKDRQEAEEIRKKYEIELLLSPDLIPAPDAEPLRRDVSLVRQLHNIMGTDHRRTVELALSRLPDPLPSVENLHAWLGLRRPQQKQGGWQFYVYLTDAPYQRLLALANAAGVTRNQIIEALIYTAGECHVDTAGESPEDSDRSTATGQ